MKYIITLLQLLAQWLAQWLAHSLALMTEAAK
jgi:hypothetical protein